MRVAVTGATGLIGTALVAALRAAGHETVGLGRPGSTRPNTTMVAGWDPTSGMIDADSLASCHAVVHLAGRPIAEHRFTPEHKKAVRESRVVGTRLLAETLATLNGPQVLLSGSAIGFYGDRATDELDETSPLGHGFLAEVCEAWEEAATSAIDAGIRTCHLRTGLVMTTAGGALARVLPLFRAGLGGRIGTGRQYWSWVSRADVVRAIFHLLTSNISGPVNLTSPEPLTNRQWTDQLGRALGRPTVIPTPKFGPRLLMGREGVEEMLLSSQRVMPRALIGSGFEFEDPTFEGFLTRSFG